MYVYKYGCIYTEINPTHMYTYIKCTKAVYQGSCCKFACGREGFPKGPAVHLRAISISNINKW